MFLAVGQHLDLVISASTYRLGGGSTTVSGPLDFPGSQLPFTSIEFASRMQAELWRRSSSRLVFVVELVEMPWTIVFVNLEFDDLEGREVIATFLSKSLACEALGVGRWWGIHVMAGQVIEQHYWDHEFAYKNLDSNSIEEHEKRLLEVYDMRLSAMNQWFVAKMFFCRLSGLIVMAIRSRFPYGEFEKRK